MEKTFLIIDDDDNIRKMLQLLIKKNNMGRVVCELNSGEHAIQEILFYNPQIVLVDLLLPIVDGIEIIRRAKEQGYRGKFIMISQVEEESVVSRAYENGITFFISKPINSIEAINVIKGICHNIELENSLEVIKSALLGFDNNKGITKGITKELFIEEEITNIFTSIGIAGSVGSNELIKIIHKIIDFKKRNPISIYKLQKIYDEIVQEEYGYENQSANKKALEQRIRRTIQKALENLSELGCDDYSNSDFMEYSVLLFDFKQIRQEMRHINNPSNEPGKISTKKFIEGIISKLS